MFVRFYNTFRIFSEYISPIMAITSELFIQTIHGIKTGTVSSKQNRKKKAIKI